MKFEVVRPDAERMIEGLRETGYVFKTAVADLIDNSIAAEATKVDIQIHMDYSGEIILSIADNGYGMSYKGLIDGMKYGSPPRPSPKSLGKFGLGMKTASTAFCRRFSATTRSNSAGEVNKATWDLDHVADVDEWQLLIMEPNDDEMEHLNSTSGGKSGTVIRWEKVDRLLKEYADPAGVYAKRAFDKNNANLREHLSMVYQRFLDKSDKREKQKVEISINDIPIEPWDPFCSGEAELVAEEVVPVGPEESEKISGDFKIRAFILPRKEEFSSEESWRKAKISIENQGFYIYRENRLIHGPDWLSMYIKEPHGSLLRVEFSFGAELDEMLHIDLKKSKILLNETLFRWLKDKFLGPPRRAANDRYRRGRKKKEEEVTEDAHDSSNVGIRSKEKEIPQAGVTVVDGEDGEVEVTNPKGRITIRLPISTPNKPGEVFVQPVTSIDDGMLWTPVLIEGHQGIQVNRGHEFYRKVYLPNIISRDSSSINVQGIDFLLWAIGIAELQAVSDETRETFSDIRYEVSRTLRKLVEHLPEPPDPEE